MIGFIDEHKDRYGIEPICGVLPIVPSTYYAHHAQRKDPQRRSKRAKRDAVLQPEIERVWGENFKVYGARKVWLQLNREALPVARCTVARLMKAMGIEGVKRGRRTVTTLPDEATERPQDAVNRHFGEASERLMGGGPDVCGELARLRIRGLRHRRLRAANRRLAGIQFTANGPCAGCAGAGALRPQSGTTER